MLKSLVTLCRGLLIGAMLLCLPPVFAVSPPQAAKPAASSAIVADADKLDLNTATADQLKALPGIGDAYTKRIIDGRPYTAKNQLTTRGILPQKTYDGIKDAIVARRPAKK